MNQLRPPLNRLCLGLSTLAVLALTATAETTRRPGLAKHRFCQPQFEHYSDGGIQTNLTYTLFPHGIKWPSDMPQYRRHGWSLNLRGGLTIEKAGRYTFRASGTNGAVRLNGAWFPVEGDHELSLPDGRLSFELFQVQPDLYNRDPIAAQILWRTPDSDAFTPIPPALLTHTAADTNARHGLLPDVTISNFSSTLATLDGEFVIPESGFYRYFLRCSGQFKGGARSPAAASVTLNGQPALAYYARTARPSGVFGELSVTRYLEKGAHTVEIIGDGAGNLVIGPGVRMGLFRIDPINDSEDTLCISEATPGQSVFRKDEHFTWTFEQATDDTPPTYQVEVTRQRSGSDAPIWTDTVTLPANQKRATASLTYPCPEEGAFEYTISPASPSPTNIQYSTFNIQFPQGPWEFVVIDPTPLQPPKSGASPAMLDAAVLVDTIDCTEGAGGPHQFRDNGSSTVVGHGPAAYRKTGLHSEYVLYENVDNKSKEFIKHPADYKGAKGRTSGVFDQDWFAYTLKVEHPENPHLIVCWVPTDAYRRVPVQVIDTVTGGFNGATMEVEPSSDGELVKLSFPYWPNTNTLDITTASPRSRHGKPLTESAIARIELYEYPDGFPPLPEPTCGWNPDRMAGWGGEQLNLGIETRTAPRLQNDWMFTKSKHRGFWMFHDYKALWQAWSRFGEYSRWRGDNFLIWAVYTYQMTHIKTPSLCWGNDAFASGIGTRPVDKYRRNSLKLILLLCEKYGIDFIADIQLNGGPKKFTDFIAKVTEADPEDCTDLFLEGGRQYPSRILDPSHPVARDYLIRFYGDMAKTYGSNKAFKGIYVRQMGWSSMVSAWFLDKDTGYGDGTIARFEQDTGLDVPEAADPKDNYKTRKEFLVDNKENRAIWFKWRADKVLSLRKDILAAVQQEAPQMRLFSPSDSCRTDGAMGNGLDMRLAEDPALGFGRIASYAEGGVEVNKLDPYTYKNFDVRKGFEKSTPEDKLGADYGRAYDYPHGLVTGSGLYAPPNITKKLAHVVAESPVESLFHGALWTLPATDDALRQWYQTWRAIPSLPYKRLGPSTAPIVHWSATDESGQQISYLINTTETPLTARLALPSAQNMVTGGMLQTQDGALVVDIPAYGLVLLRHDVIGTLEQPKRSERNELRFRITNPKGLKREHSLVVIKGSTLLERLPEGDIEVNTLSVTDAGQAIPVQIDEKDTTGHYVDAPNHVLDVDDELCFQLSFADGERSREVKLSISEDPTPKWPSSFSATTNDTPKRTTPYTLAVTNGDFQIGFVAKGGLSLVRDRNVDIWNGTNPSGQYFNGLMPLRWATGPSTVHLRAAGPVRALIDVTSPEPVDIEWALDTNPAHVHFANAFLKKATHTMTYELADGSQTIRFRDTYDYEAKLVNVFKSTSGWQHKFYFGAGLTNSVAHYSASGDVKTAPWRPKAGFGLNGTKNDNWIALWNPQTERGLQLIVPPQPQCGITMGADLSIFYHHGPIPEHRLTIDRWVAALPDGKPETAAHLNDMALNPLVVEVVE